MGKIPHGKVVLSSTGIVHITGPSKSTMGAVSLCGICFPERVKEVAETTNAFPGKKRCKSCFVRSAGGLDVS